jgi:cell fate regulator YaaT (PSP1 superfamily)
VTQVVSVVFNDGGKAYQFSCGDLDLHVGDQVIVETARGLNLGKVIIATADVDREALPPDMKRVVRTASKDDLDRVAENRDLQCEAREVAAELIAELGLAMKVVDVEATFDQNKITFSFFAENRVDFRELVARLSDRLGRRVELRQVSSRDEARLIGGYGSCGRRLCCTLFAGDQEPVSIRMAKDQGLPLNPAKISGVCGRLMCCLKYERDTYTCFRQRAPRKGRTVSTPAGTGRVVDLIPTRDSIVVDLGEGKVVTLSLDEIAPQNEPAQQTQTEPAPQAQAEAAQQTEPAPQTQTEPAPQAQNEPAPQAQAEPAPQAEAEPTPQTEPAPQTEAEDG